MNVVATLTLLFIAGSPEARPDQVRISLLTLFKPETLHVRIASGEGAVLDGTGLATARSVARGELVQIRLSGNRLHVLVDNSLRGARQSLSATEVRITPVRSATLELILPGRIRRVVSGSLTVDSGPGERGPLRIVLTTDRESAVASVVASETSRRETEALKALAVAVRTFMISHAGRHSTEGFDFCDTTHCQLYQGERDLADGSNSPAVASAVAYTAGQFLSFKDGPIESYYTAACGGMSATPSMVWGGSSSYPYSRIACRWCRGSRFDKWERSANAGRLLDSLSAAVGTKLSLATELITERDEPDGFVRSVIVQDGSKRTVLTTDAFRRAIGLKLGWNTVLSPTFRVERRGSSFIFRGRGFGSQIGLCEEGAAAQAAAGRSYREILNFYYPGAQISEQAAND